MQPQLTTSRISSLDYLRGLTAFGIMCYHLQLLAYGEADAVTALAKIKIFGAAVFYIISGIVLYKVYEQRFSPKKIRRFYKRRIFRIVPLLLLATVLTYMLDSNQRISGFKLLCNIVVLPGIIRPDILMVRDAWTVGNECGFYLFFPALLMLAKRSKLYLWCGIVIALLLFVFISFFILNTAQPLEAQWLVYTNVLNQFFLFALGMGMASLKKAPAFLRQLSLPLILALLSLIFFYKIQGEPVVLATGYTRLILTAYVTALCYCMYIADFAFLPLIIKRALQTAGDISYSLFLLHPLVFLALKKLTGNVVSPDVLVMATIAISLPLSYVVYQKIEKYFIDLSKKPLRVPALRLLN